MAAAVSLSSLSAKWPLSIRASVPAFLIVAVALALYALVTPAMISNVADHAILMLLFVSSFGPFIWAPIGFLLLASLFALFLSRGNPDQSGTRFLRITVVLSTVSVFLVGAAPHIASTQGNDWILVGVVLFATTGAGLMLASVAAGDTMAGIS